VRALTLVLAASLAACESPFVPPPPTTGTSGGGAAATLTLRPDSLRLFVDDTFSLIATVRDSQGQTLVRAVNWSVDDSSVAEVLSTGVLIALDSGHTMVRATVDGLVDSTLIRVTSIVYASISSGAAHSCAVGNNARVYCWGSDGQGQLGVAPPVLERTAATAIAAGGVFVAVAAGDAHACGADRNFEMHCWGANDVGQLGLGGTSAPQLPTVIVSTFDYVSVVAGGGHTCALTQAGTAVCWGRNSSGELGKSDTATGLAPALAAGGRVFVQLVAGTTHTCGLTPSHIALCWGGSALGQLGDSGRVDQSEPDSVRGAEFTALAAGGGHTCGLDGGPAFCWGSNQRGESGTGLSDTALVVPAVVTGGLAFASLTLGSDFTCGLTPAGAAYCWGGNDRGQLGDGTQIDRPAPTLVNGGVTFTALSAGRLHVCGVAVDHSIYCWGDGTSGQLGLPVAQPLKTSPTRIPFPN